MLPLNTPAMVRTLVVLATLKYSGLLRRRGFCGQDFCLLHKCQLFIRARFDVDHKPGELYNTSLAHKLFLYFSDTHPLHPLHPPHTTHTTHHTRTHNTTQTHTHADEGANTSNVSVQQCAPPNSLLWTCSNTDRPLLGRTICRASFSARVPSSSSSPPSECPPAARLACCWKGCASETCWRSCI